MRTRHHDKIQEALELLNEAARDKKEEIYEVLENKYSDLKEALFEQAESGKEVVTDAAKKLAKKLQREEERLVHKAKEIDKTVHRNPWPYVGGAALAALIFGVLIGKK